MEKEEKILGGYIDGTSTGEDNKLQAAIGSLNAKRSKELTDGLKSFQTAVRYDAQNLILSVHTSMDNLARGIGNSVTQLNDSVERQVDKLISSNESLAASNDEYSQKTQKSTRVNILLTFIITATGIIGLWNIYLTNQIKNESIRTNQINEQPLLIFTDFNSSPYKITNSGKGVAFNFVMIVWDKYGKHLMMTPDSGVGEALAVGASTSIPSTELVETNFDQANKVPIMSKVINKGQDKDTSWFAIVYDDIYGNPYATLIRGPGKEYADSIEFLKL